MVSFVFFPRAVLFSAALLQSSSAFVTSNCNQCSATTTHNLQHQQSQRFMSTVIPGTETETEKREKLIPGTENVPATETDGAGSKGPIEWLIDDRLVSREDNDPFHILLLDETYVQKPEITIEYVASSCTYVIGMPYDEAAELAAHAEKEGFSCLGTWSHEECQRLGKQLQNRDLICRVVPFCEGGDRAWQARNMKDEAWEI
mmetsp:Transcript_22109/g.53565  ORF Transcript_22109/g.53565 Transcript_22109/m.53565 type:complete len:202 (-) Transcript_22109:357-962(-)|eukprot:CAMPEP_0181120698 /NCGR_PEP_ID=MMETSP1071-20121207/24305_1 /TAXON_ID=35127 /ORGANISM="Thalassiosira sp., Strain NH16" /LENGTH=201 /DNA_ID=CAMNT_0023205391 /DNA_START=76 /DNA_END=681 /DNA_ORIENTATION=-